MSTEPSKSPGQRAYEKYAEYQLRIPREQVRPLTWEELGQAYGNHHEQWEEIARAAIEPEKIVKP